MINEKVNPLTIKHASLTIKRAMFLERMFTYFRNAVHNSPPARE